MLHFMIRPSRCENCKWFNLEGHPGEGECRRYPPKISNFLFPTGPSTPPQNINITSFPVTKLESWCGEHVKGIMIDAA